MVEDVFTAILSRGASGSVVLEIPHDLVAVLAPFFTNSPQAYREIAKSE